MSFLGFINRFFFQLFCVRLCKSQQQRVESFEVLSYDLMSDGNIGSRGSGKIVKYQWYSLMLWVVPFTGWGSDFVYLNKKPIYINLTKEKVVE